MGDAPTTAPTLRLMSWNMGAGGPGTKATWDDLAREANVDVGLLQEAPNPWWQATELETIPKAGSYWGIEGMNRAQTAIARLSDRVEIEEIPTRPIALAGPTELGVSRPGTVTVAKVRMKETGEEIIVASVYAQWERPLVGGGLIFSDASMHRLLSDLTPLLTARRLPIIVAGDFNTVLGSSDDSPHGNWTLRTGGVFRRLEELDLRLQGPHHPNGEQAAPRPPDLQPGTVNVPTYVTSRGNKVSQLDYCCVTPDLVHRTEVRAHNAEADWGPSDHCRVMIDVGAPEERSWTEESFIAELSAAEGREVAETARHLMRWAEAEGLVTEIARGVPAQWAAIIRNQQYTFCLRSNGQVLIPFQHYYEPFGSLESREPIRARLNEIEGVHIEADRLTGRPSFPLRALVDESARAKFLDTFSEVVRQTLAVRPQ